MTAPVRITIGIQDGDRVRQFIAEADQFDTAVEAARKMLYDAAVFKAAEGVTVDLGEWPSTPEGWREKLEMAK